MAHREGATLFNVFIGEHRLIQNVEIVKGEEKGTVKLIGDRAHKRWTFRKDAITRKVKLT